MSNRQRRAEGLRTISRGFARDSNRAAIFATILTRGPLARSDIARETGLSAATVSKVVKPLVDDGYVAEMPGAAGIPGRPTVPVTVNPTRASALGFKLTSTHLTGVIVDLRSDVLATSTRRLRSTDPSHVVTAIAEMAQRLPAQAGSAGEVLGIGIGIGGHVSSDSRVVQYATFLGWRNIAFADLVEASTGLEVLIENDVDALAVAEQWFGLGKGVSNFALVTVGAGVGSAYVVNDALMHGASGLAGELGHLLVARDGERCVCGNRGCLETLASESAIVRRIEKADPAVQGLSFADAIARALEGDAVARKAFQRAGDALGVGVSAILNLLNPELVLISGEGLAARELLLAPMRAAIARHTFSSAATDCRFEFAPHAADTWARGAAALVLHTLISRSAQLGGGATS